MDLRLRYLDRPSLARSATDRDLRKAMSGTLKIHSALEHTIRITIRETYRTRSADANTQTSKHIPSPYSPRPINRLISNHFSLATTSELTMRRRISNDDHRLCRIRPPLQLMQCHLHRGRHRLWPITSSARRERLEERVDFLD
jgi:hypothetical protein